MILCTSKTSSRVANKKCLVPFRLLRYDLWSLTWRQPYLLPSVPCVATRPRIVFDTQHLPALRCKVMLPTKRCRLRASVMWSDPSTVGPICAVGSRVYICSFKEHAVKIVSCNAVAPYIIDALDLRNALQCLELLSSSLGYILLIPNTSSHCRCSWSPFAQRLQQLMWRHPLHPAAAVKRRRGRGHVPLSLLA